MCRTSRPISATLLDRELQQLDTGASVGHHAYHAVTRQRSGCALERRAGIGHTVGVPTGEAHVRRLAVARINGDDLAAQAYQLSPSSNGCGRARSVRRVDRRRCSRHGTDSTPPTTAMGAPDIVRRHDTRSSTPSASRADGNPSRLQRERAVPTSADGLADARPIRR